MEAVRFTSPSPTLFLCPSKAQRGAAGIRAAEEDDEGGLARRKSNLSHVLLRAGYFCAGFPADSPYLPRLRRSGRARLFDLPREHSVCFGDAWPELTSLQMVSK